MPAKALPSRVPDFVVIGAMRAGTTSLHQLLETHPQISVPRIKETDFFLGQAAWQRGYDWYKDQFNLSCPVRGEISPNYTKADVFPGVPQRLFAQRPDAKLIYIVRDPVARAQSQYAHGVASNANMPAPNAFLSSHEGAHILQTSHYGAQLQAWLNVFPQTQLLVVDFDDLCTSPQSVLATIAAHIGVSAAGFGAATTLPKTNSSAELSVMPRLWLRYRNSPLGISLRKAVPRTLSRWLKKQRRTPAPQASVFSQADIAAMQDALKDDIAVFRALTGQEFTHWSL